MFENISAQLCCIWLFFGFKVNLVENGCKCNKTFEIFYSNRTKSCYALKDLPTNVPMEDYDPPFIVFLLVPIYLTIVDVSWLTLDVFQSTCTHS